MASSWAKGSLPLERNRSVAYYPESDKLCSSPQCLLYISTYNRPLPVGR